MNPVATSDAAFRGGACPTPEYTIAYTGNYTTSADANSVSGADLLIFVGAAPSQAVFGVTRAQLGSCRDKGKIHSLLSYPHVSYGVFQNATGSGAFRDKAKIRTFAL
jgi:hypothetical protein